MNLRVLIPLLLLLAACDQRPPHATDGAPDDARTKAIASEQAADEKIMDDARITTLQKQVNGLETQLSELKDGEQAISTRLLEQRLQAVEQRVYARAPTDAPTTPPTKAPVTASAPRPTPRPSPSPSSRTPLKLNLPPAER